MYIYYIYIYIHICTYICVCVCIYVYMYKLVNEVLGVGLVIRGLRIRNHHGGLSHPHLEEERNRGAYVRPGRRVAC